MKDTTIKIIVTILFYCLITIFVGAIAAIWTPDSYTVLILKIMLTAFVVLLATLLIGGLLDD